MIKNLIFHVKIGIIFNLLLLILVGLYLNISFVLLDAGLEPRTLMFNESPIEGMEFFSLSVQGNSENHGRLNLAHMQDFYYETLQSTSDFLTYSLGRGQPLRLGAVELVVEKLDLNAFNLFGQEFELLAGRNFEIDDFLDFKGRFPIILGYAFNEANNIGDVFVAEYFFTQWEFEVIGILESNQRFSNVTPEHHLSARRLDNYVLVPFVSVRYIQNLENIVFWTSIYEVLIQARILVEPNENLIDYMMNTIYAGLHHAGLEMDVRTDTGNLFSSLEILNLIRFHQLLIFSFFVILTCFLVLILIVFSKIKIKIFEKHVKVMAMLGEPIWKIKLNIVSENLILFALLFIILHEYWMWDSGLLSWRGLLTQPSAPSRWQIYELMWENSRALSYTSILLILVYLVFTVIPIILLKRYYRGRKV